MHLDDLELSILLFLPTINHVFPGCGITIHNVEQTPYKWWRRYAQLALEFEQSQESSRGK